MHHDEARNIKIRSPEQEQKFKIQQLKANNSCCYIREQFNKELGNLKITKTLGQDVLQARKSLRHNLEEKHNMLVNRLTIFILLLKM